jgi:hypothetical protein
MKHMAHPRTEKKKIDNRWAKIEEGRKKCQSLLSQLLRVMLYLHLPSLIISAM